jgi:rhodanese-related sulfurtransferase
MLPCAAMAAEAASVPAKKRTQLGFYLEAREVPEFIARQAAGQKPVLFIDVRTAEESLFVGAPGQIQANIPAHVVRYDRWNEKRASYDVHPNPAFVPEVLKLLAAKGLDRDAAIVLICRSGDRSAMATSWLANYDFGNVWSVVDGFEGDLDPAGRRAVNGWKNAGLPWGYQLNREAAYVLAAVTESAPMPQKVAASQP